MKASAMITQVINNEFKDILMGIGSFNGRFSLQVKTGPNLTCGIYIITALERQAGLTTKNNYFTPGCGQVIRMV